MNSHSRMTLTTPGTQLRWRITAGALERVWAIGYIEDSRAMRCVVPPSENGAYRNIPDEEIVTDGDVLAGVNHHVPRLRHAFSALAAEVLASAQEQARARDPHLTSRVSSRAARATG